jgi:hypothetical protein
MTTRSVRGRWLTRVLLTSSVVGTGGGFLSFLGGDEPAKAVIAAGTAFGGATALFIAILAFVLPPGRGDGAPPPEPPAPKE